MSEPILVVNAAFGAIKYHLVDVDQKEPLVRGKASGIGQSSPGEVALTTSEQTYLLEREFPDHRSALAAILGLIEQHGPPISQIAAVAHRVVHGADRFTAPTVITPAVLDAIRELSPLAPAHNPKALSGILAAESLLPDIPHVAVFDTSFFADLPAAAATYALPVGMMERLRIRKYGFHGLTHRYVSERASLLLGRHDLRQIVCYLGNGSSISAVDSGRPIDVSTGFTMIDGLPTRARSGSIDPGIHRYVMGRTGMDIVEFDRILSEESGMLGLTGMTDQRQIWTAADQGDERAALAIDVLVHRIVSYVSAFHGVLGGAQAIAFTGTVGEQDVRIRKAVCDRLACFGVEIDEGINAKTHGPIRSRIISTPRSAIAVLMVQQREPLAQARECAILLGWKRNSTTRWDAVVAH
ncbi:MAG: acetate/propionate family kinase [Propionibacteriaceae bacterium]|nr:acetate/propionate family kinase [Propionibacteriaceae bacterium]